MWVELFEGPEQAGVGVFAPSAALIGMRFFSISWVPDGKGAAQLVTAKSALFQSRFASRVQAPDWEDEGPSSQEVLHARLRTFYARVCFLRSPAVN